MAHVLAQPPHQVSFPHRPVNHAPSPLGFGFGLSAQPVNSSWNHSPLQRPALGFPTTSSPHIRIAKRRYEHDEDDRQSADESMERSPTPERPKRAAPKRARTTPASIAALKDARGGQPSSNAADGNDVDVGLLLGADDIDSTKVQPLTPFTCSEPTTRNSAPRLDVLNYSPPIP